MIIAILGWDDVEVSVGPLDWNRLLILSIAGPIAYQHD